MSKQKNRILTGITTTGTPHLGNYLGAIKPAIEASFKTDNQSFYFLADYHALVKCSDAARVQKSRLELAATWLACGLDPAQVIFYRQSDISEIGELNWLLTCVAAKGLFNRAHAYKAAVDANLAANLDADAAISMGLYCYPALMAADILLFNADFVPVGSDQIQHIEMTRDIAARFNHLYNCELFTLPSPLITSDAATLPGIDGRKMSKSYNNTLPLFANSKDLQKLIAKIITDSKAPGEPKDYANAPLFKIYAALASAEQSEQLAADLGQGMAWGDAKKALFELIEHNFADKRERYLELINKPQDLEDILHQGALKAREIAKDMMAKVRDAVGLRNFNAGTLVASNLKEKPKAKKSRWISYRENDAFYFKKIDENGKTLIQSIAFKDAKSAFLAQQAIDEGKCVADGNNLYLDNKPIADL